MDRGWHWRTSIAINRALCGSAHEPLCARAHRRGWHRFSDLMQVVFRDPTHTESVYLRWRELNP